MSSAPGTDRQPSGGALERLGIPRAPLLGDVGRAVLVVEDGVEPNCLVARSVEDSTAPTPGPAAPSCSPGPSSRPARVLHVVSAVLIHGARDAVDPGESTTDSQRDDAATAVP